MCKTTEERTGTRDLQGAREWSIEMGRGVVQLQDDFIPRDCEAGDLGFQLPKYQL